MTENQTLSPRSMAGELIRIMQLPIEAEPDEGIIARIEQLMVRPESWGAPGWKGLYKKQAEAVLNFIHRGSFAALMGVGHGKTGASLMVAGLAAEVFQMRRTMLCVPNRLVPQLLQNDIPWWRKYVKIQVTFHPLYRVSPAERRRIYALKPPGCYIVPYSMLQTQDASAMLEALQPELLILDEAHNLSAHSSARTFRVFGGRGRPGYFQNNHPKVVILSGTITSRNLDDYYHLLAAAIGKENMPMPNDYHLRESWDNILSTERGNIPLAEQDPQDIQAFYPLLAWARAMFPDLLEVLTDDLNGFRRAYRLRLITTPGVVATSDDSIGTGLELSVSAPRGEIPPEVQKLIEGVEAMQTPDGRELPHAMHKWLYLWVLSSGFFYKPVWPKSATPEQVEVARVYSDALQAYYKVLRQYLKDHRRPGHDTPFLVGKAMQQRGASGVDDPALYAYWAYKQDCKSRCEIEAVCEPVWVSDFKLKQVADDIRALPEPGNGAIVWYQHVELGKRLAEYLAREFPGRVVHCPAGPKYDAIIIDPALRKSIVVASLMGHGEGKNLQYLHQGVFAQLPHSGRHMHQVIGRLHRNGQDADTVFNTLSLGTPFEHAMLGALLMDATYQHSTSLDHKALSATWLNHPMEMPESYMIERGLRVRGVPDRESEILTRYALDWRGLLDEDES